MRTTPRLGTDGDRIVYPVRGMMQAFRQRAWRQQLTLAYVVLLVVTAVATAAALVLGGHTLGQPLTVIALGVTAAVAERGSIRLTRRTEQSISVLPTLFAAVVFGPLAAGAVGAASMLGDPELMAARDPLRAP